MDDVEEFIASVARGFCIPGTLVEAQRYGNGHINDTFLATYACRDGYERFIHQRINGAVFPDIPALMDNIGRVTRHVSEKLRSKGRDDLQRRALTLIPTNEGGDALCDEAGRYWRTYIFVERARTYDVVKSPAQAYEAAKAFGEFSRLLSDLPAPRLNDTIPDFHNTGKRFGALLDAIGSDRQNRALEAKPEIAFALQYESLADALECVGRVHDIPRRATHNDTKLNNVMIDDATGEGICVIDLDTVMPGLSLCDFGDMARTATMPVPEDERDLSQVKVQFDNFEAIVRGFMAGTGDLLHRSERENLLTAAMVITFETGIRFLADFLKGDVYFRVHRYAQNLDRARTQFALVRSFERNAHALRRCVEAAAFA